jgi:hypothetical protein
MPGNTRLALAQDLGKLTDGQLHDPKQCEDPKPRGIGERLKSIGQGKGSSHELRI